MRCRIPALCLAVTVLWSAIAPSIATADGVPPDLQAALLLRTLAYDHKIKELATTAVTVAVVFKPGNTESEAAAKEMVTALEETAKKTNVAGLPAKAVSVGFGPKLESDLKASGVVAIYVCPGLDGSIDAISKASRAGSMLTFTGNEAFTTAGLSIALVIRSGRAGIVIMLKSAEAEGADLDGALLRIAEVRK